MATARALEIDHAHSAAAALSPFGYFVTTS